jgi:peptidoglycan hydrolase CwlO-like protein
MMTELRQSDEVHDTLIRLKENVEYFQDSVIGDIQELDKKVEGVRAGIASELCVLNKRVAECEKDMIRKKGECDSHQKDTAQNKKDCDKLEAALKSYDESIQKRFAELKEQQRKDLGIAITITSFVVGLVTFLITFVLENR